MMTSLAPAATWQETNQRRLTAELARVRALLERHVQGLAPLTMAVNGHEPVDEDTTALARVCALFGLSPFERDILLLCAGVELDARFGPLCGAAQGDPARTYATFSLALAALPDAHWSALTPVAPLRAWRHIEVGAGTALTTSPLRIDERILHELAGLPHLDERLDDLAQPVAADDALPPSQRSIAAQVTAVWQRGSEQGTLPPIQLRGGDPSSAGAVAAHASASLGLTLMAVEAASLPAVARDLGDFIRLWEREAALAGLALLLACDDLDAADPSRIAAVSRLIAEMRAPLVVAGNGRVPSERRPLVMIDLARPTTEEQAAIWRRALGDAPQHDRMAETLAGQFSLSPAAIHAACAAAGQEGEATDRERLWDACRGRARPRLEGLARRLEARVGWDDLVLPAPQQRILREVAVHVRQRVTVYERWGFAARHARGLGISLLAAGPSGTGKTMAAEVLANELRLDLYYIDLSQVVSKYIGETEKNLARLFDAAEGSGAILLFDEADALFGKRSEVKDSHDRYANIEISYLLQRMEAFHGLAILTTNMKDALDSAFLRRIRFVVQFPFPDAAQRAEIWRRVFPRATPTQSLDIERLARLNLSGGSIRNVAMNAAFLAADAGEPVGMTHLAAAARGEYLKLEKPLSEHEIGGWA
jgi:hypothetical protein